MGAFFFGLALWLVYREIHTLGFDQIVDKVTELPLWILGLTLLFIACDYVALSGYDFLALRYIGAHLKKWLVLKNGICGVFGNEYNRSRLYGRRLCAIFFLFQSRIN